MPSFKTLSCIAAFAFAAFTGASPLSQPTPIPALPVPRSDVALAERAASYSSVPTILKECHEGLKPLVVKIKAEIGPSLDVKVVLDHLLEIKVVLGKAIKSCHDLQHPDVTLKIILFDGIKLWLVVDVANLLCDILKLLFGVIYALLCALDRVHREVVFLLCQEIGGLVCDLLTILFGLLVDLKAILVPLLCIVDGLLISVAQIILCLKLDILIALCGGFPGILAAIIL